MSSELGGRSTSRRLISRAGIGLGLLTLGAVGLPACSGDEACISNRSFFEQKVWSSFMSTKCYKCHSTDGVAVAEQNAKFILQGASYPGFIDANLDNLKMIASIQQQGTSELLLKPIGKMNHGGGQVIQEGDADYQALTELVKRFDQGDQCGDQPSLVTQGVKQLDALATFRKAAIALGGRLPTVDEENALKQAGDKALDAALDNLFKEDLFYERLKELYNDVLLTDKFADGQDAALNFLEKDDYPGAEVFKDPNSKLYGDARSFANDAVAREPLNLIEHVVRNNRPFTEIMTADYALVNPFQAIAYGISDAKFKDSNNPKEFQEGHVRLGTGETIPHAGVLSTPVFLNRWQTTPTNRNRGRSRRVFKFFLGTDVLKIAERPVDPSKVTQEDNPTRNSAYCNVCHRVVDPVAGTFRGYDDMKYAHFDHTMPWYDEMFSPGFGPDVMPAQDYGKALPWLASEIASDPRFVIGTVYTIFSAMTGHDPLTYPADASLLDFQDRVAAWSAQDAFLRGTADKFKSANFDLRVVFKEIVKSVYYRAIDADSSASDPKVMLAGLGTGRLLSPEMLNRKIMAVVGVPWRKGYDLDKAPHYTILEDYRILYGGIDSDSTVTRLQSPNGVIANIAMRMASEVACEVTAYDFTKAKANRRFFPLYEKEEVPESAGHPVDASVADIKANIKYLHHLILGEDLTDDDPELARTYQVFLDSFHELQTRADSEGFGIPDPCKGGIDWATGTKLPDNQVIDQDPNLTIRSWQAVLTYLLSDYKFIYE